jgi:hypothetical protein
MKSIIAGALALVLSPSQAQAPTMHVTAFTVDHYVVKVQCSEGSGSAFRLESGQWVSANHVTSLGGCSINGTPIEVTYFDALKDYSLFNLPDDNLKGGLKLDCHGYQDKQWYYGEGAAWGIPILTAIPVMDSAALNEGFNHPRSWKALIYNRFIPGQSGGAVRDAYTGAVVGIVNAYSLEYPISLSIPLSETVLCQTH